MKKYIISTLVIGILIGGVFLSQSAEARIYNPSSSSLDLSTATGVLPIVNGGTGSASFGQGWLSTAGGTNAITSSTSPTVNYITATSTTATSIFPYASTTVISSTGSAYFATSGGSVGIGSTLPGAKLQIAAAGSDTALLGSVSGSASNSFINFAPTSDNIARWGIRLTVTTRDLAFDARDSGGNPVTVMTLLKPTAGITSGALGIGTTTPTALIDSYTTASSTNLLLETVSGRGGCLIMKDVNGAGYTQIYSQAGSLLSKVATALSTCN